MKPAVGRFRGSFQAITLGIVKPAMVRAGNAPLFDPTVTKGSPAMRAAILQETDPAFLVAEKHECFTENSDQLRGRVLGKLVGDSHWKPVPAQQFSGRGSSTH